MNDPRFVYVGSCHCSGGPTKKYKYGTWLVYIGSRTFKVKKNGVTVKGTTTLNELETYLSKAIPAIPD